MELITTYICKAFDIGINNNMFGGTLMSIIDDSAASYASQLCDTPSLVTVKFDSLVFTKPVSIGSILKIYGRAVKFGNTSIELYIEVRKHNVYTAEHNLVTHTNVTMVKVDEDGKPIPLSEIIKERYKYRVQHFGKGLLTPEETKIENQKITLN